MQGRASRRTRRTAEIGAATHIGASPRRMLLEDRCLGLQILTAGGLNLVLGIVADGVGGEQAGERAAELTLQTLVEACRESRQTDVPALLTEAIREANARVYREACRTRRRSGMSSTVAVAAASEGRLFVAAAGDSRIYLARKGRAIQLTRDHTWGAEAIREGRITPATAAHHPRRGDLVRSIGLAPEIDPDIRLWMDETHPRQAEALGKAGLVLQRGDAILVTTDGLTKERPQPAQGAFVDDSELSRLIRGRDAEAAAHALVAKAVARGTDDNVSVVVLMPDGHRRSLAALRRAGPRWVRASAAVLALGALAVGGRGWSRLHRSTTLDAPPLGMALVVSTDGTAEVRTDDAGWAAAAPGALLAADEGMELRTGPGTAHLRLELGSGSMADLGPDTHVSLVAIGDDDRSTVWALHRGVLLVFTSEEAQVGVDITGPRGTLARVLGSLMGVWIDAATEDTHVDCFHSKCAVVGGSPAKESLLLRTGEHACVDILGAPVGPDPIRCFPYAFARDWVPCPTPIPESSEIGPGVPSATPLGALFVPPTATRRVEAPDPASGHRSSPGTATEPPAPTPPPATDPPPETEPPDPTDPPPATDPPPDQPPEPPEPPPPEPPAEPGPP